VQLSGKELSYFISKTAGEQVIVNLKFQDDTKQAILKEYQVDPVSGKLLHVDFQEISATELIKVMVHVVIQGEGIRIITEPYEVLASVIGIKEEVAAPEAVVAEVVEPEVIKKGKKTEEE